ncbi:MAG: hypothetical protein Q9M10_04405 [Mariprofundaceae bacterium]|nr:hypothetical protein [Mariprofundaceae bacterium]
MPIPMLDAGVVIAQLKRHVTLLQSIEGSASLEYVLKHGARTTPAAFVVPLAENPSDNQLSSTAVRQRVETSFAVMVCVKDFSDARGATALKQGLMPVRQQVLAALIGFSPLPQSDVITHAKGSLLQIKSGVLIWQDHFKVGFYRSSQ